MEGCLTVKPFVRSAKEQNHRIAYHRFETEPGLQAQVDWGDFKVVEADGRAMEIVDELADLFRKNGDSPLSFLDRCSVPADWVCQKKRQSAICTWWSPSTT